MEDLKRRIIRIVANCNKPKVKRKKEMNWLGLSMQWCSPWLFQTCSGSSCYFSWKIWICHSISVCVCGGVYLLQDAPGYLNASCSQASWIPASSLSASVFLIFFTLSTSLSCLPLSFTHPSFSSLHGFTYSPNLLCEFASICFYFGLVWFFRFVAFALHHLIDARLWQQHHEQQMVPRPIRTSLGSKIWMQNYQK